MRVYLPATVADLTAEDGIAARWAHAVTPALRAAMPDEDDEGLEMTATMAAADDSVRRLAAEPAAPRRVVLAADVADSLTEVPQEPGVDRLPTAIRITDDVPWHDVVALLVDEPGAEDDVRAAAAGDDEAFERSADRDLLWYDTGERGD